MWMCREETTDVVRRLVVLVVFYQDALKLRTMKRCECHCCRTYGECDADEKLRRGEWIWARHLKKEGAYSWKRGDRRGRRVKLCKWCIDSFQD